MTQITLRPRIALRWLACFLILFQTCLPMGLAHADGLAGVSGGTVVAGQATITQDASTLNVNTASDRTIINWNGFSIGAGETANFFQPGANSAVLNRVTTPNNPSAIFGAMNSNGNVILVNPSGIVVGNTGVINTNGFTASVLDIPNNEFLQGGVLNFRGDSTASVINNGTIKTGTGGAALIGGNVINNGSITSEGGSISLATGGSVLLADGSRFTHADMATIETGISPTAGLIKNSGTIRATGAMETGGEVFLVNPGGKIMSDGTIAAYRSGANGSAGGDVRIAAVDGSAELGGTIDVAGVTGGSVTVEADTVQLASANIDASGDVGGGKVNIGGGFQGNDASISNARTTSIDANTTITVDATIDGNAGTVIVWSDEATDFYGSISATGGETSGNGGLVEVSGSSLVFEGSVDTTATMGETGWLLLDPIGIAIITDDDVPAETDAVLTLTDTELNELLDASNVLLATSESEVFFAGDEGSDFDSLANDDNIVVGQGTAVTTGDSILYFSSAEVDLYADIEGNVSGAGDLDFFDFIGEQESLFEAELDLRNPTVVNVFDTDTTTGSIQDAVDIVGSGGTINVGDGTFAGGIVIDKTVSLLGDGSSNTSLIEVASDSAGMTVIDDDVVIDGFRFVPESGAVNTTGILLGRGFRRARNTTIRDVAMRDLTLGIDGNRIDQALTISGVDLRRIEQQGVIIRSPLFFDSVLIEDANIVSGDEAVLFDSSLNGSIAAIRSSRLVSEDTDAVSFDGDVNGSIVLIEGGNRIRGGDDGIDIDGNVNLFSQVRIAGNNRVVGGDDSIDFDGNLFLSSVAIADNGLLRGDDDAINFDGLVLLSELQINNNGDIQANDDGLRLRNVALSRVGISGNNVQLGSTGVGLRFNYSADSELTLGPGNSFDGGVDGIVINGSDDSVLTITGNTINDTAFSNQSGDYIRLEDTALFDPGNPTVIDARNATFEGLRGIEMTPDQLFATEDKMVHFPDDNTLGLFDISDLFVVEGESIQLAVNAAGALGGAQEVVVGEGTFGGSVEVWVDNLTLLGTGETTVIDTDQVDAFANNGDRDNGFELTTVSDIAANFEINNVTIDGFAFEGTGETTGVLLGQGFRRADDTIIQNSFFNGLTDGIAARSLDDGLTITNVRMRNISEQGIDIRTSLGGDEVILIEGSNIVSDGEAVRFNGSVNGSDVTIASNRLRSRDGDGVRFAEDVTAASIEVADNRIIGDDDGIDFDDDLVLSSVDITGNRLIEGGDDAIALDDAMTLSRLSVTDNEAIIGGDDGINLNEIILSAFSANGNDLIEGVNGSGIEFDGTVFLSDVEVIANEDIIGGEYGVEFDTDVAVSSVRVARNDRVRGLDFSGISFRGEVDSADIRIINNERIRGGDDGVEFEAIEDSLVRIARNERIVGDDVSGIGFYDEIADSNVRIINNDRVEGGVDGIEFDALIDGSLIRIARNERVIGNEDAGVSFDEDVFDSTVRIVDNDRILGERFGVDFDSGIEQSLVRIAGNRRILGEEVSGIRFDGDIEESTVRILNNRRIIGDNFGIDFDNPVEGSRVRVAGNRLIEGEKDSGVRFDNRIEASRVRIVNNDEIIGGDYGVEVDGTVDESLVRIVRNEKIAGGGRAGIAFRRDVDDSRVIIRANEVHSDSGDGVRFLGTIEGDSVVRVIRNAIKAGENGIVSESVQDDARLALVDNVIVITNDGIGILLKNIDSSEPVLVRGGSTTGGTIGLAAIQEFANIDGQLIVDGLVVNQATDIGLLFQTLPAGLQADDEVAIPLGSKTLNVVLMNEVTVNGGTGPNEIGMVFDGEGLSLAGDTLADTRFVDNVGNFIELRNGGLFEPGRPTLIDGMGVYWDGLDPGITAQRQQIIDRIVDFLDDPTLGLIFPGAGLIDDQTYDRFTRYDDYFRTIDSLMGPFPTGSIIYRTPIIDVEENLEQQAPGDQNAGQQSAESSDDPTDNGLASK
ncbi:MAG: filamentous hemagglutinin N-terminal domain-containing protein [Planctomycetota bacterium]